MKNYLYMLLCVVFLPLQSADNEIYVDQSGTGANIDLEQLGISNIIGGLNSTAGNLTAFDLDGATMTLDINMIGNTNKFLGDINATTFTGLPKHCLLYTSPSPRDGLLSRMPSSA